MIKELAQYKAETEKELDDILHYWLKHAVDEEFGGFVGKIDHENKVHPGAAKGSVLNSRILWAFSAAYNLTRKQEYLATADRAYEYLVEYFIDKEYGGVYWLVDHKGAPLDTKKQIYALAFAAYGLSEYYKCSNNGQSKLAAIDLYEKIVRYSYDEKNGGYLEALSRDWKEIGDLRLSAKDANEKKSMNTHLHVMEAFATLYQVWPDEKLKCRLVELINIFLDHIIDNRSFHLKLFFDEQWNSKSEIISYGHDIEAAWLIQDAAELAGNELLGLKVKHRSVQLANAAAKGLDGDGGLWYEYDAGTHHLVREKHSWPQAEGMVGFFNAWQNTGDEKFLRQSMNSWKFVKQYMHDKKCGEWFWGVYEDYSPMTKEDKVGVWKCPYHNSRACIEIIRRINSLNL